MANERKTVVTYLGDGSQKSFAFPFDYLRKSFVKAMLDGEEQTYGVDYTVNGKQLDFAVAPAENVVIVIYRETTTDRLVAWEDASVLRASDMTLFEVQLLHIAEETQDKVQDSGMARDDYDGVWDGRLTRIKNVLDPVYALDVVNKQYFDAFKGTLSDAQLSEQKAKTSETNAKISEVNAKASENAAKISEVNAKASENAAKTSETNAANSASQAATSAFNAANSATQAYNYMQQTNNAAGYTKAEADARFAPSGYGIGTNAVYYTGDLNDLYKGGLYYVGNEALNRPADWCTLLVLGASSQDIITQIATRADTGIVYVRTCANGVWGPWNRLINSGNIIVSDSAPSGGTDGDIWMQY